MAGSWGAGHALLLPATKNRSHRSCIHDSKILITVVEDRIRTLDAMFLQIVELFGKRLGLSFRIQISEPLGRRDVAFEPALAVPAMKANIDLVACTFDNRPHDRTIFGRVDRGVVQAMRSRKVHRFGAPGVAANPARVTELDSNRGSQ